VSRFQETVEKIAQSPQKMRLLEVAPHVLVKKAGKEKLLSRLFGATGEVSGAQKVMGHIAQGIALTGATATGALVAAHLEDQFLGNADQAKATNTEIGKLNAQNQFKTQMVRNLGTSHQTVLKNMMSDEVIGSADTAMINSAFETMKRFAPNLAADENATRSFLREHAIYGTGPSYASLKNLADAEQAVAKAGGILAM
jgi:hypothetical protein